jgi:hypothetical protein
MKCAPAMAATVIIIGTALSACRASPDTLLAPLPATCEQIEREVELLQERFFKDACFSPLIQSQSVVDIQFKDELFYEVPFPSNPLVSDAFSYTVYVQKKDRQAYLMRTGGIAGIQKITGPAPLTPCLQDVFTP